MRSVPGNAPVSRSVTRVLLLAEGSAMSPGRAVASLLSSSAFAHFVLTEVAFSPGTEAAAPGVIRKAVTGQQPDAVLLCLPAPEDLRPLQALLTLARTQGWTAPVVVAGDFQRPEEVGEVLKMGASDFMILPLRPAEAIPRLLRLADPAPRPDRTELHLPERPGLSHLVGHAVAFRRVMGQIPRIARCDAFVLVTGETGVGKELVARAIHHLSRRSDKPFVPVNCGAIPADLFENELFGHEPGAYTNAGAARRGLVKEADGGTLFLDEVDCLPPLAQVKLLRFLQDGRFRPLGAEHSCSSDVRAISASNADLAEAVHLGQFRRDLFYRLNVISLVLPSLRDRPEDIPLLACHFLAKYAKSLNHRVRALSRTALQKLLCYDWPGNVRELENVIERTVALAEDPVIGEGDITIGRDWAIHEELGFRQEKDRIVREFERDYLKRLLLAHGGNIAHAAATAHKDRRAFWELMRKHHLCIPRTGTPRSPEPALAPTPG